jgi:hypothetical protein
VARIGDVARTLLALGWPMYNFGWITGGPNFVCSSRKEMCLFGSIGTFFHVPVNFKS